MTDSKLIDSSIWVDFLINSEYKEIIEQEEIFLLSTLSLFEIKKKLIKLKYKLPDIEKSLKYIKEKSNIIAPDKEICEEATDISIEKSIGTVDAIIYTTALKNNAKLITSDNDFRNLSNAQVLK